MNAARDDDLTVSAPDADDLIAALAPDHPMRLLVEALRAEVARYRAGRDTTPEWSNIKTAAGRFGCTYERMRQLAESGAVVSRRDGGLISILTASVDERLWLRGRRA
jgi:hypothetical protein